MEIWGGKKNYQINVAFGTGLNTILECTLSGTLKNKLTTEIKIKNTSENW